MAGRNGILNVLSVDPSSPFHQGALLGDRIRMPAFYMHPDVYIRSLGSRGNLGGLSAHIIEVLEIIQQAPFDLILLETVGVGQSEVEIAGLADITVVVFVPEAGDDIQTMKAGLMEVADVFVVNKADRARADELVRHLQGLVHERGMDASTPVLKCVATEVEGVEALYDVLLQPDIQKQSEENRIKHLAEKAWQLIQHRRMKDISKTGLQQQIKTAIQQDAFNLYRFVSAYNP